ncbi:hypothetical protein CACET_c27360 [Clostridium aceticum]|uniref:Uncharacterized protein n=1 Tax=Clostridium aceticum TaxID=84022 RepID=A0A0D8I989_9CLOT|nr:hypothetical protein [Clostridium aceticum]AKL96181.1 hypothetical protein CACET_c27360 [Clostridium aceticum]KJF26602.1 hypothetical protein TZ02_12050 [Clostridium aceticum]
MNMITSESLDRCLEYCDIKQLASTNYGTFIRALVYTMKTELPVEVIDNENNIMVKAQPKFFSIAYREGQEGISDSLNIQYVVVGEDELKTLKFEKIGRLDVIQDKKNSTRTFYRYYIKQNKNASYRFTFNRRISKN